MTQSAFRLSLQPDWLIKQRRIFQASHGPYSNPGAQMGTQKKGFGRCLEDGAVSLVASDYFVR